MNLESQIKAAGLKVVVSRGEWCFHKVLKFPLGIEITINRRYQTTFYELPELFHDNRMRAKVVRYHLKQFKYYCKTGELYGRSKKQTSKKKVGKP